MRRLLSTAAALVPAILLVLAPTPSRAELDVEEMFYGFNVNASLGYAIPNTDEYENSFYLKAGAGYSVNDWLTLDLCVHRFSADVEHNLNTPPGNTIADGELNIIPITLNAQFRYPVPQLFGTVYALAGVGYYFIDYSWSDESKEYFSDVAAVFGMARQNVDNSFGFQLGGGFDYPLTAHLFLNLEGQYVFLSPKADGQWRDLLSGAPSTLDGDLDLNTWIFSAGIKYLF